MIQQLFSYPLPNIEKHTIEHAASQLDSAAAEYGFTAWRGEFKVKKFNEEGKELIRLECMYGSNDDDAVAKLEALYGNAANKSS